MGTLNGSSWSLRLRRIRRPTPEEIAARLTAHDQPFSYPEVGATSSIEHSFTESLAATYDTDVYEFHLGTGRSLFESARDALLAWRHFDVPWLEFHGASAPAKTGQVVATLVSVAGLWFFNPCRVVYTEYSAEPADLAAFAYGTLQGHVECGEERFQVSLNPISGEVKYEIAAFSRPAILLSKLGYPLARRLQKRFANASSAALLRAAV